MEASVEQQLVIGSPPVASEFQPNGLWVVMECPAPAAAPKVWQVHAYAYVPCRIDWGDNTGIVAIPNEYAVSGQAPGLWTGSHTYGSIGPFECRIMTANGVYMTTKLAVGPYPYHDSEAYRLTQQERWALEAKKAQDMAKARPWVGDDPGNTAAPGGTVSNPETKQSGA